MGTAAEQYDDQVWYAQQERRERRAEAIAQGYVDEICSRCGVTVEAHIHFVRCDATPCPMRSTKEPRTLLERLLTSDHQPK